MKGVVHVKNVEADMKFKRELTSDDGTQLKEGKKLPILPDDPIQISINFCQEGLILVSTFQSLILYRKQSIIIYLFQYKMIVMKGVMNLSGKVFQVPEGITPPMLKAKQEFVAGDFGLQTHNLLLCCKTRPSSLGILKKLLFFSLFEYKRIHQNSRFATFPMMRRRNEGK